MEQSKRRKLILSAIIENFIQTGEPVGSKNLITETGLEVSSATVRNDMAALTQSGYLVQPHTSAGRVPTQIGYRYYIDNILKVPEISENGKSYIEDRLYKNADSPENILKGATELLTELTGCMAVATTPNSTDSRVHKISFVQTGLHTAMVVLISSNGIIKSQLFRCDFSINSEMLTIFDKATNDIFAGVKLSAINRPFIQTAAARFGELSLFMTSVLTAIKDAAEKAVEPTIFISGQTKLLFMSEMNFITAGKMLEFFSNTHDFAKMLDDLPFGTNVSIGTENSRIELANVSVISSSYELNNTPSGMLAIISQLRTDYGKTMSIIENVADSTGKIISELIEM